MTFNKLGVTLNLEDSATGHHVIDLILDALTRLQMSQRGKMQAALENVNRNESGKDSEDAIDNSEFSNLICGSENVTVTARVSLVAGGLREILPPMDDWKFCE